MNDGDIDKWKWKRRGVLVNYYHLLSWARIWNSTDSLMIPSFEVTTNVQNADIRVQFSGKPIVCFVFT